MKNPIRRRPKPYAKQQERIPGERFTIYFVMTMTVAVILLAFLFDFGNVWALAARLGVPDHVQALVAPAVSFSYLGLMVGQQYLGLRGWSDAELRRPRIWLGLMGVMTYGLNCADAFMRHAYGEALFDAVMPTLLLIWGEIGPWLMRQVHIARTEHAEAQTGTLPAVDDNRVDHLARTVEELLAEFMAKDVEQGARKKGGRRESRLRPTARQFIKQWLASGKTYDDHPAAAWHKVLVAEMGEGDAPTVVRCRQIMRDEFPAIEAEWKAVKTDKGSVDERIDEMEEALTA
ncbi:hypothetical protein ACJ6WD_11025 [Streptomyces sp. VTCC 41912]|uniref:hypothetical protein n=1 Tax=Streptomyces sp. VTCC 41912 TaxID=3383243 RepID=UPI003896B934